MHSGAVCPVDKHSPGILPELTACAHVIESSGRAGLSSTAMHGCTHTSLDRCSISSKAPEHAVSLEQEGSSFRGWSRCIALHGCMVTASLWRLQVAQDAEDAR